MTLELYAFERHIAGPGLIAGTDEAGAGPLAGPVVAAAVILAPGEPIDGLNDSKQLSEKKREQLFDKIMREALATHIVEITPREIDAINILRACLKAMTQAVLALDPVPNVVLVDARRLPGLPMRQQAIVKGDARCASIAAASILAKVHRDRRMQELHARYPEYGFDKHKGYGCPEHLEALRRFGPSPVHRQSFAPVRDVSEVEPVQASLF